MKLPIKLIGSLLTTATLACDKADAVDPNDEVYSQIDPPSLDADPGPPVTWRCDIDELPDFIEPDELLELLQMVNVLSGGDVDELARVCATIKSTILEPIRHSTGADYPPDVEKRWAQIIARYWWGWNVELGSEAGVGTQGFRVAQSAIDAEYPCGQGPNGLVLCPTPAAVPQGELVMIAMILGDDVPLVDDTHSHQYAFVFDADGDAANDYMPSASYPFDFFAGTDLWLEALYDPSLGWTARASSVLADGQIVTAFSWARIVITASTVIALVPRAELGDQACPEHRMTAFTHLGDYGLQPPHVWMGDTEPTVEDGLEGTCD